MKELHGTKIEANISKEKTDPDHKIQTLSKFKYTAYTEP